MSLVEYRHVLRVTNIYMYTFKDTSLMIHFAPQNLTTYNNTYFLLFFMLTAKVALFAFSSSVLFASASSLLTRSKLSRLSTCQLWTQQKTTIRLKVFIMQKYYLFFGKMFILSKIIMGVASQRAWLRSKGVVKRVWLFKIFLLLNVSPFSIVFKYYLYLLPSPSLSFL